MDIRSRKPIFAVAMEEQGANGSLPKKNIPISVGMRPTLEAERQKVRNIIPVKRVLYLSAIAVINALVIGIIARGLIALIALVTNLAFFGKFSLHEVELGHHTFGWTVILVPVIGGILVGFMAKYGSKAIRGHGIPEAMEQILTNKSKIPPRVTILKPLSAAISIGTGGPFGAEGPIISTGGAFGSFIGQASKVTDNERKILLAAGATAGMAAIFGSPFAAILLAIELLLFEFSPRSIIPVALSCLTGAACHIALFSSGPMFHMPAVAAPTYTALANYSIMGGIIGVFSALITRVVYLIEDGFEKLPIHWMWWPALGSIVVGVVGYIAPATLGVGYENISTALSGETTIQVLLVLCFLKLVSWAVSLGSGTSGGTLAPMLTIGGAAGALMGMGWLAVFPGSGINIPTAALVGMAAMFAGASRALLTSIVFALETTMQANTLTPLLGGCTAAYFVSFFLMENTIMTEKIARRGIHTPHSYAPDLLDTTRVKSIMKEAARLLSADNTIAEVRSWLAKEHISADVQRTFAVVDHDQRLVGTVNLYEITDGEKDPAAPITSILTPRTATIYEDNSLRVAVDMLAKLKPGLLPVVSRTDKNKLTGVIGYDDILNALRLQKYELEHMQRTISLKRRSFQIIVKGRKLWHK